MIDIERCRACTNVSELLKRGLGHAAINAIATEANFGVPAVCNIEPKTMPGGWMKCSAQPEAAAGLRGAVAAVEFLGANTDESLTST